MNATELPETAEPAGGAPDPSSDAPRTHRPAYANVDPRQVKLAAGALVISIIAGVLMFVSLSGSDTTPSAKATGKPRIIEQPNSGKAPENPGDRGGLAQVLLLGGLILTVSGIGFVAMRGGGRSAKAGRDAWMEAGRSGHDGAVEG